MIPPPDLKERIALSSGALLFLKEIWPLGGYSEEPRPGDQVVG